MKHLNNANLPFKYTKTLLQDNFLKKQIYQKQLNHKPYFFRLIPPFIVYAIRNISIQKVKTLSSLHFYI